MNLKSRYDAIVIGGGHNGLVAAAYLGQAGKSVLVLEKNAEIGGATASQKVFPDYEAYLSRYSYLVSLFPQKIIDDLGLNFQTKRRRTASFTPYRDSGGVDKGLVLSNEDSSRSETSMREMTGSDEAWSRYLRLLHLEEVIAQHVWPSMLQPLRSKEDFKSQMKSADEVEAWRSFVEEPLGNVIERYADHDALRGLLMTDGKIGVLTHPGDESLLQNRCFLYHVVGGGNGEWRVPIGGMRSLVNSLLDSCRRNNVDIRGSAAVSHLEAGREVQTITAEVDGKTVTLEATDVLVACGPRSFAKMIGRTVEESDEDEGSAVKINMLLRRLPKVKAVGVSSEEAFAGSFHIDEGYEQMKESYRRAIQGEIPDPAPGEIYCHTLTDPSILSPELQAQGYQTLTLFGLDMAYRIFEQDHDARKKQVLDLFLAGLDHICDESFRDCLAIAADGSPCIEIKTPQDLEKEVDLDRGNIFHNAPSWFYAPTPDRAGTWGVETQFPHVWLAGSAAYRGGAVSGIPGHNAARAILGD